MTARTYRRSPLAVVLLVLLAEEPMHAYRMQRLIRERNKDQIVNIAQRNSVYQTLDRLLRAGMIEVRATTREENRPERTVYQITDEGRRTLRTWLRTMLSAPAREFPEFPVALASLPMLPPQEVAGLLEQRAAALEDSLAELDAGAETAARIGLPRLFVVEDEYQRAITAAELRWVRSLLDDLREGRLDWDEEWLRGTAERLERPE
ncbi:PadR family transcriptional regulator [Allosalinactinospora lopnorensis]|uniref:PadR family transcriptional regulator n=1 Tax=Allosalinactinospora lopnorensis TaxID=1352348 RepID=UPI000623FCEC|nr:PadR family transcriptional regulator [Allosalinactinospora lopnorensis]